MGEPEVALGEAELLRIGDYVKGNLKGWLTEVAPWVFTPDPVTNTQLLERIIRLEERFEHVDDRFVSMDKRFEAVDRRFEAVDKRFEAVDKRFEAVDKRFDDLIHTMDKRFEDLIHHMDKRFGTVQWMILVGLAAAGVVATLLTVLIG